MDYIFIAIFGAIIGSFLGVVVGRLHSGKSMIWTRSECLSCQQILHWFELLPVVSFLLNRGRCRHCKNKILQQDFWIEIVCALLFLLVYKVWLIQSGIDGVAVVWFLSDQISYQAILLLLRNLFTVASLVVIFLYDLNYYLILDKITVPSILVIFILNIFINNNSVSLLNMLWGVLIAGGFFLIQFLISRGKWIGGGDIRLGILMGVLLGMPHTITALVISYVLGSVVGIGLIIFSKRNMKSQVPFGTFLSVGTVIALLWSDLIIDWYVQLFL